MESPFPGVDPYIEQSGHWQDFHLHALSEFCDQLSRTLPDDYVPMVEERVALVEPDEEDRRLIRPDIGMVRDPRVVPRRGGPAAGVALLELELPEPTIVALPPLWEEIRETRVEIVRFPGRKLVTVIELLSPMNKADAGYSAYVGRREALFRAKVNLVEIDLLLGGRRPPIDGPWPPGDAYALVSRNTRYPLCDLYIWSIRRTLPTIPIPLASDDPDVPLDLAVVPPVAYRRGRYGRLLSYDSPLTLPLAADDRAWAESLARAPRP